jgi:AraC-like DNA-binding protein
MAQRLIFMSIRLLSTGVDDLTGLLDGPRARGAFLLRCVMNPPWSLRIVDEAPLTLLALARGTASVTTDSGTSVQLGPGDVAIVRGPEHYTIGDHPTSPPDVVIHPGQHCVSNDGRPMAQEMSLGVRTWGNDPNGSTVMLVGTYESAGAVSESLLRSLPPLISLPRDQWDCPIVPILNDEVVKDEPGQHAVLDRLLDLLVIATLREWFARPGADVPHWYRAQGDPIVGHALRLLNNNPDHSWTVAGIASQIGVSRAAFARRFNDLVGEPPMSYLTKRRLSLAADLLMNPDTTIGAVARQVGYSGPFALSTAFKRQLGVSPREYRTRA